MSRISLVIGCIAILAISCNNYSRYAIDVSPVIKTNHDYLGIWKCKEDMDKNNTIIVQTFDDVTANLVKQYGSIEKFENKVHDHRLDSEKKNRAFNYYITSNFKNNQYFQWTVFMSEINNAKFLNVTYRSINADRNTKPSNLMEISGYLFLKILDASSQQIVATIVRDSTLKMQKSSIDVRNIIAKNINNKYFYSDTLHFYKINSYHSDINIALKTVVR